MPSRYPTLLLVSPYLPQTSISSNLPLPHCKCLLPPRISPPGVRVKVQPASTSHSPSLKTVRRLVWSRETLTRDSPFQLSWLKLEKSKCEPRHQWVLPRPKPNQRLVRQTGSDQATRVVAHRPITPGRRPELQMTRYYMLSRHPARGERNDLPSLQVGCLCRRGSLPR